MASRIKNSKRNASYHEVKCKECKETMTVSSDAVGGICWRCVSKMA